ncbi:MAG: SIMPL domain-containing protein [Parabacteroides sp.]|nr:SIMPL domain-containing protein [Parabacteroides sp.]
MGKLKITGNAKKEFKADAMEITITIATDGETSAHALNKGKKETEKLLQLLVDIGIDLSSVTMKRDSISGPGRYNDDKLYRFEKNICFMSDANLTTLEMLSSGIIKDELNATYTENFCLYNTENAKKEVLQDALLDSKKKAEAIAETLGQKITGIDCAKCDEYDDDDVELLKPKMCLQEGVGGSLATQLSPDMITIEKSIDVSWIVE